jgi:hypothetical protein
MGTATRTSFVRARRLSSGLALSGVKRSASARALRLISALPSRQRQIRSGFSPMME